MTLFQVATKVDRNGRQFPRRFLDGIHLNRVDYVRDAVHYRQGQWKDRRKNLGYDIMEMDLTITTLKEEDNKIANEAMEESRALLHRNGKYNLQQKRDQLLKMKEILEDPDMWYGDWMAKHHEEAVPAWAIAEKNRGH